MNLHEKKDSQFFYEILLISGSSEKSQKWKKIPKCFKESNNE